MVRRRCGPSSPSRPNKRRLYDGVHSSDLVSVGEDKMISAEQDLSFVNTDKEQVSVGEEGYMDVDEEEEDENREDSIKMFQIGDEDVWETKRFSKYWKENWACFDYNIDDDFYRLPKDYFKPGEDPRSRSRSFELKMGHSLMYRSHPSSDELWEASDGTRLAVEFFNNENQMGKTYEFKSISKLSIGTRRHKPSGTIYFITFVATEIDSGVEREFQASFFRAYKNWSIWYLRALREKPYVF